MLEHVFYSRSLTEGGQVNSQILWAGCKMHSEGWDHVTHPTDVQRREQLDEWRVDLTLTQRKVRHRQSRESSSMAEMINLGL